MRPLERFDADAESLERRLRDLPPLPVPADLEARLLAAIPAEVLREIPHRVRASRRRRTLWAGVGVAFAVAYLLLVFLRPKVADRDMVHQIPVNPGTSESAHKPVPNRPDESLTIVTRLEDRRRLMDVEKQLFTWPIHEKSPLMVSSQIPRDLLD